MKYIRTKDGRIFNLFNLIKWNETQGLDENEVIFWNSAYRYPEKHKLGLERRILKQADTIEELCDEFVFVGQDNVPILMETLQQCLDRIKDLGLTNHKIYAAIWTDKGLIYVAKMNEKGELELI